MKKFLVVFAVIASFTMNQTAVAQEVNDDLIRVFKWYNSRDKEYVILADGEIQEGQLLQW